jgi:Flp pilus assembly protein CpaB
MMGRVTSTLGNSETPSALRATPPGWRDPRLWVGLALVAASVVVGARVLAQADEATLVWAAAADLPVGQQLAEGDLVATRVRFLDDTDAGRYLAADRPLPERRTLLRPVAAGELVPADALGDPGGESLLSVPVSVPRLSVPPDVGPGSLVDVWVTVETGAGKTVSRPLLSDVVVLAAPPVADGFGATGERQLVLGVSPADEDALGRTLAAAEESGLTIVGRG